MAEYHQHQKIALKDLDPKLLGLPMGQFPVPTEYTVESWGQPVPPIFGRLYMLPYVKNQPSLCLVEVWEDHGDDGHLEYRLEGYVIMTSAEIKQQNPDNIYTFWFTTGHLHKYVEKVVYEIIPQKEKAAADPTVKKGGE